MIRDKNSHSEVRKFKHQGNRYRHVIFSADDDRVECRNSADEVILTYTKEGRLLNTKGEQIGRFIMRPVGWRWHFVETDSLEELDLGRHPLDAEVQVSIRYLEGQLKFKPEVKE